MSNLINDENLLADDPWGIPLISVRLSESFEEIAAKNPELKIEQNANGEFLFISPTGGESGHRNSKISSDFSLIANILPSDGFTPAGA